jgi:acetolactate synthase I/II/III large subunit
MTVGYDPVEYWPLLWNGKRERQIIHADVLPADIDNCYSPQVELIADIAQTLEALTPHLQRASKSALSSELLAMINHERQLLGKEAASRTGTDPSDALRARVAAIRRQRHHALPRHGVVSPLDRTSPLQLPPPAGSYQQRTADARRRAAVGDRRFDRPSLKILSISGDGGFLFSAMELETAVRLKANIVHMVWVDGSYDMVGTQEMLKYGRRSGVDLGPIDYVKYAEAFGAKGLMIESPEDIVPVLKKAFDIPGPVIVGVHVDYSDNHKLFEMVDETSIH